MAAIVQTASNANEGAMNPIKCTSILQPWPLQLWQPFRSSPPDSMMALGMPTALIELGFHKAGDVENRLGYHVGDEVAGSSEYLERGATSNLHHYAGPDFGPPTRRPTALISPICMLSPTPGNTSESIH